MLDQQAVYLTTPNVPHSREAEEAVLGAVLINPIVFKELNGLITSGDFYLDRHKWIWEAFKRLAKKQLAIDIVTVSNELDSNGQLKDIGGDAYLTTLANVPDSYNAASYAKIVAEHSVRRMAIQAANEIVSQAYDESHEVDELISSIAKADLMIQQSAFRDERMVTAAEAASRDWDRLEQIAKSGITPGIKTGLIDLDHITGGYRDGELIIIAALRGDGKTAMKIGNAGAIAKGGKNVAVFSLEMSSEQVVSRLISDVSNIDGEHLRDGTMTESEWHLYTQAMEEFEGWNLVIDDTPALTPEQLIAKCTRLKSMGKLDIVFVDYVQLMRAPSYLRNREQEIAYVSRNLKYLARELKIPVVAGAQVNRESERTASKRLYLHHLRESAALEHDSDVVIFIQPDEDENVVSEPSKIKTLTVAKNRNGKTDDCEVLFFGKYTSFRNGFTK